MPTGRSPGPPPSRPTLRVRPAAAPSSSCRCGRRGRRTPSCGRWPARGAGTACDPDAAKRLGGGRSITRDLAGGRTELLFDWDCGGLARLPNGLLYEDTSVARYSIVEGDPLSARVEVSNTADYGRGDWRVHIEATGVMTSTATHFLVSSRLDVYEGETRIAARAWDDEFPRDHG